ncbi:MAG: hypothetical protein WC145_13640 [Aliarcobacter sp.]|nr:hypothetical protein [Acholeplasmataceae bacterium]
MQKEYRFPFKAQVFAETMTGMSLDQVLANIGRRTVLGHTVFAMLSAVDDTITTDEVYDLMDAQLEKGSLEAIETAVIEEVMVALGNPQADIKQFIKAVKLEDAARKRAMKARIAKSIKDSEAGEVKEPPGPGDQPKN